MMRTSKKQVLQVGTPSLDEILSPKCNEGTQSRQKHEKGGLIPGMLHVFTGPQKFLSGVLMRLSVVAQLPPVIGGINAKHVFYVELNNYFDPYLVSKFTLTKKLTPSKVLERIEISRGFNWDQSVEIVSRHLPAKIRANSIVLISGLTKWFDPRESTNYEGLREMLNGLKKCFYQPNVYMVATAPIAEATAPIAEGSKFKPRGGTNLTHFAGCIISILKPKKTRARSTITEYFMSQHPLYPQRRKKYWDHSANKKIKTKKSKLSTFRMLEDFF